MRRGRGCPWPGSGDNREPAGPRFAVRGDELGGLVADDRGDVDDHQHCERGGDADQAFSHRISSARQDFTSGSSSRMLKRRARNRFESISMSSIAI
jgi:hypothetical protein